MIKCYWHHPLFEFFHQVFSMKYGLCWCLVVKLHLSICPYETYHICHHHIQRSQFGYGNVYRFSCMAEYTMMCHLLQIIQHNIQSLQFHLLLLLLKIQINSKNRRSEFHQKLTILNWSSSCFQIWQFDISSRVKCIWCMYLNISKL